MWKEDNKTEGEHGKVSQTKNRSKRKENHKKRGIVRDLKLGEKGGIL